MCVSIGVHISMHTLSNTLKAYVRALVLVCVCVCVYELYLIKHTESIRSTHHFGGSGGIHTGRRAERVVAIVRLVVVTLLRF